MSIRGFLFDMGGVLCRVNEEAAWQAWQQHTGLPGETLRYELYDRGLKEEFDLGMKLPQGVALFLATRFEIEFSYADWKRIWGAVVTPDPEMDALALQLAQLAPTALASNTDPVHHAIMQSGLRCLKQFREQVVSYKIYAAKPDKRFYERAVQALGTDAGETLFIDDRADNVAGAIEAGLHGLLFTGIDKFREDLSKRGIDLP